MGFCLSSVLIPLARASRFRSVDFRASKRLAHSGRVARIPAKPSTCDERRVGNRHHAVWPRFLEVPDRQEPDAPEVRVAWRSAAFHQHRAKTEPNNSGECVAADVARQNAEPDVFRSLSLIDEVESSAILTQPQDFGYLLWMTLLIPSNDPLHRTRLSLALSRLSSRLLRIVVYSLGFRVTTVVGWRRRPNASSARIASLEND